MSNPGEEECESLQDDLNEGAGVNLWGVLVWAGQRAQGAAHRDERCKNGNLRFCELAKTSGPEFCYLHGFRKCDIDADMLYLHRRNSEKANPYLKQVFCNVNCKNMSVHHSRVARRDHLKNQPRCQRRSTILTSTKMTSTNTGMLCCQRLGFICFKEYTWQSHCGQALAKLVPKTHCMSEQEWRNLGVQQSLGWVFKIALFKVPIFCLGFTFFQAALVFHEEQVAPPYVHFNNLLSRWIHYMLHEPEPHILLFRWIRFVCENIITQLFRGEI